MEETQGQMTARIVAQTADATAKAVAQAAQAAAALIAKENSATLVDMALLKSDVATIKQNQSTFESEINRRVDSLSPKFEKIYSKLEELAQGRPTWTVTIIITFLSSVCLSLIVYTVTH